MVVLEATDVAAAGRVASRSEPAHQMQLEPSVCKLRRARAVLLTADPPLAVGCKVRLQCGWPGLSRQ